MGRVNGEVKAEALEEDVFIEEQCIAPAPVVLAVLVVDNQRRVLLRHTTAGDYELFHAADVFLGLGGEEQGGRGNLLIRISTITEPPRYPGCKKSQCTALNSIHSGVEPLADRVY